MRDESHLPELYLPNAQRLARALNLPPGDRTGAALLADVIGRIRDLQRCTGCHTNLSQWQVKAADLEQIVMAVATDPLAVFFPIPPEKIQEITLKAVG